MNNKKEVCRIPQDTKECFYHLVHDIFINENISLYAYGPFVFSFDNKLFAKFEKTVKTIIQMDEHNILIGSYDGTCMIFRHNKNTENMFAYDYIDTIKGPETEIKGLSSNGREVAMATRGKTVWIFKFDFLKKQNQIELTQILEDHDQDVKGNLFLTHSRLCTWSYDETVKIYDRGVNEWELIANINFGQIVWNVLAVGNVLCAFLHSGEIEIFDNKNFEKIKKAKISELPLTASCSYDNFIFVVSNMTVLCVFNVLTYKIEREIDLDKNKVYNLKVINDDLYVCFKDYVIKYLINDIIH
ncbi:CIA1 [Ecytonucleospora hepatopenaei]|uniref:CIA1 n=1 Tax=Ecytonucleospora hepatopenaei TaxID=646526 RepID=A0A1W0E8V9_9MICR|nr:CIA1 [Ecytonucleospora hepatopenaei]